VQVAATVAALKGSGVPIWHDITAVQDGDNIVRRLGEGLEQSRYLALFASKAYFARSWTRLEYEAAIYAAVQEPARRIFIVQLEEDASIPLLLAGTRRIPFTNAPEVARRLYDGINALNAGQAESDEGSVKASDANSMMVKEPVDWASLSELAVIASASAIWERRREYGAGARSPINLLVDIEKGRALNIELVASLVANDLLMVRLHGELDTYRAAVKVAGLFRAALIGNPGSDVPTMLQAERSMERAQSALDNLRSLCRDLSRSIAVVVAG